jgi:hypothetical protein
MSCEICGRSSCTKSFHSLESQKEFDDTTDSVKDRMRTIILGRLERCAYINYEEDVYIKLDDAIKIVEDY